MPFYIKRKADMKTVYRARLKKLRNQLRENQGILISDPENAFYFSGVHSSNIHLYITQEKAYLLTDFRYRQIAETNEGDFVVLSDRAFFPILKEIMTEPSVKVEQQYLTVFVYNRLREHFPDTDFSDLHHMISDLRLIKDDYELSCLKRAQEIADRAYGDMLPLIKEGITEKDLKAELEYRMVKLGAYKTSFDTIVLFGERAAMPHGEPGNRKLAAGDAILCDFGCVYQGYCSDVTRTVFWGEVSKKAQHVYETVLQAHLMVMDFIQEGKACADADKLVRDYIESCGYPEAFGHSLGHGVGLKVHESPILGQSSAEIFMDGMVFSNEPGIYLPGEIGVRIEDTLYLKHGNLYSTTALAKELIVL